MSKQGYDEYELKDEGIGLDGQQIKWVKKDNGGKPHFDPKRVQVDPKTGKRKNIKVDRSKVRAAEERAEAAFQAANQKELRNKEMMSSRSGGSERERKIYTKV